MTTRSIVTLFLLAAPFSAAAQTFSDVSADSPNAAAIAFVKEHGIVSGYDDGTYRPDALVNRAEFLKIILNSSGMYKADDPINFCKTPENISAVLQGNFTDVDSGAWYAPYLCFGLYGVIQGYPDKTFRPQNPVNIAEASKIMANVFPTTGDGDVGDWLKWYAPYLHYLSAYGAIPTTVSSSDHKVTRGEMAEMVYRLLAGNQGVPYVRFDLKSQDFVPEFASDNEVETVTGQDISCISPKPGKKHWEGDYILFDFDHGNQTGWKAHLSFDEDTRHDKQLEPMQLSDDPSMRFYSYRQFATCENDDLTVLRIVNNKIDPHPIPFCIGTTCSDTQRLTGAEVWMNKDHSFVTPFYGGTPGVDPQETWKYDPLKNVLQQVDTPKQDGL